MVTVIYGIEISHEKLCKLFGVSADEDVDNDSVEDKYYEWRGSRETLDSGSCSLYPGMGYWYINKGVYIGYYVDWDGHPRYTLTLSPGDLEEVLSKPNNGGAKILIIKD